MVVVEVFAWESEPVPVLGSGEVAALAWTAGGFRRSASGRGSRVRQEAFDVVLEIRAEGGSITLSRDLSGEVPRFLLETNESALWSLLDDEDDGPPSPPPPPPPPKEVGSTLAEAFEALERYPWFLLYPVAVHPELAGEIEARVLARGGDEALVEWRRRLRGRY